MSRGNAIKLSATVTSVLIFLYLAATQPIQGQILGVVVLALVLWSLYPKRHLESSVLIIALTAYFEASLSVSGFLSELFKAYGGNSIWIILAGFVLANAMEVSGLGRRLALRLSTSMGCNPGRLIFAIAIANLALAPLSPSTTAKAFLILPICIGLVESFGVEKGQSTFGIGLLLMAMTANNICSTAFLTATVPNPISAEFLKGVGLHLDWMGWMVMALPMTVLLLAVSYLLISRMFKPEIKASSEVSEKVRAYSSSLGPLTRREKIVTVVFISCLGLWMAERLIPWNVGIISLVVSLVLLLPQSGVMDIRGFSKAVPYGSIMLFVASIFLARAVGDHRALDPVAFGIFRILHVGDLTPTIFLIVVVVIAMFLHVAFTSTTVYATVMVPIVISLSEMYGAAPALVTLPIAFLAPIALILPVNTIPNIVFYEEGWFTEQQMLKYGLIMSLLSAVIVLVLGIPYWRFLGII